MLFEIREGRKPRKVAKFEFVQLVEKEMVKSTGLNEVVRQTHANHFMLLEIYATLHQSVVAGERWQLSLSSIENICLYIANRSGERAGHGKRHILSELRSVRIRRDSGFLRYLVEK
ncbi:hypothetical protein TNCV_1621961 [Trichonephila clavipes]|nr:hypothetical protein TNCV_1621961 [Trichonephila clavipes]